MNIAMPDSELTRILVPVAAAVIILAGMKAASPLLGPLLFSVFLALIFGMLLHWLEKRGLSPRPAFLSTLVIFFAILAVFVVVIAGSFLQLLSELPRYQAELEETPGQLGPFLTALGIDPASFTVRELIGTLFSDTEGILLGVSNLVVVSGLILLTTLFLLFEAWGFSSKLRQIVEQFRPGELDRFTTLAQKNVEYLVIRVKVNLAMAIGTTIILSLLGVKYAIFWGFLAFLLGFVPYVGFWLAVIPPMLLAWVDLGPVYAVAVLAGSGLVNVVAEYILFPQLAGRGLELSAAMVFISLIVWGWILGGIGVLLAVPLTLCVQLICELFEETRWISILIGPSPVRREGGTRE
ncbi:MAG: AI-2E family transporter [Methanomicrobiales archaeon]|nr:AI-2E family transporter [Methanomicrobiales archaeon]